MERNRNFVPHSRQDGAVLLVAIVLLALAGIIGLLALNVGVFESRSTGNDLRAKMVNQVAEAGLSQGFEFLIRQHADWIDDDTKWELCGATDTKFPCGAVPAAVRGTMYRYKGAAGSITDVDDNLDAYMLPLNGKLATVGQGYAVAYGVAPVICRVAKPVVGDTSIKCSTDTATASKQRIGTFVSVARIPGESARATLTQTVGRYSILANGPNVPPILASGSVDLTGTLQIVTNPNAGGTGVPVSIWTRKDVAKHGTPNTCFADEFFRYGNKHGDAAWAGTTIKTVICDTCECSGDKSLSFDKAGNAVDEGIDILDIDGNTTSPSRAGEVNLDVRPQLNEFPCDLFEYIFSVKTWVDNTSPADYFCETRVARSAFTPDWNGALSANLYPDEAFLYANAAHVILDPTDTATINFFAGAKNAAGTDVYDPAFALNQSASGIIWCKPGCNIGSNQVVGSPDHPVLLVIDGSARIQGRVFGLIFLRNNTNGPADPATGGAAVLDMNAGAAVYGGIVVQGAVDKANGNAAVIYNGDVLAALANDPSNMKYATLPGAWSDLKSY
jgi:hypothetical protein